MEIKLDVKSLIVGLVLGLIITMTVAAINSNPQKSAESGSGRFKMLVNERRAYILDSDTGRPWSVPSDSRNNTNRDMFWKSKLELYDEEVEEGQKKK
jgi:hypothetical protein